MWVTISNICNGTKIELYQLDCLLPTTRWLSSDLCVLLVDTRRVALQYAKEQKKMEEMMKELKRKVVTALKPRSAEKVEVRQLIGSNPCSICLTSSVSLWLPPTDLKSHQSLQLPHFTLIHCSFSWDIIKSLDWIGGRISGRKELDDKFVILEFFYLCF